MGMGMAGASRSIAAPQCPGCVLARCGVVLGGDSPAAVPRAPVCSSSSRGGENGGVMAIPGLATRHPGVCKLHHVSVRGVGYLLEMP